MIPTKEQYQGAKIIVLNYESEQRRLHQLKVEEFRSELTDYFKNNLLDGYYRIREFELNGNDIIPRTPSLEESYEGGNNKDIKELCEKHNVEFSIVYWCYHK